MADTQEQATEASQPTQPTQSTQPAQPVAKELIQNEFWVSGMLNGTFYECDGPYYTTKDVPTENYPYTTIKPDPDFTSQKYDYINHKWVDTSADALRHEMESIRTAIKGFQQTATTLQQGFASQSQAQEDKDEETEKTKNLLSMVVKQVGAISDKIDGTSTKLNENSATTPAPAAAPATTTTPSSTTAPTTAPVATAAPAGSTTQTAPATPAATTTQTADETKKEGTN